MTAYLIAFLAGFLTVLAPCVLPLLPIIIGSTSTSRNYKQLISVILGLSVSIFIFTLVLRTTLRFNPLLENLSDEFWRSISGGIILVFGIFSIFPEIWNKISLSLGLQRKSDNLLEKAKTKETWYGPFLLGAALGPVFSSCSPTYFVIIGLLLLEGSFYNGVGLLLVYILGLALVMFLVGYLGFKFVKNARWLSNPNGVFKKVFGLILVLVGIAIIFALDKKLEAALLNTGIYDGLQGLENSLSDNGKKL